MKHGEARKVVMKIEIGYFDGAALNANCVNMRHLRLGMQSRQDRVLNYEIDMRPSILQHSVHYSKQCTCVLANLNSGSEQRL